MFYLFGVLYNKQYVNYFQTTKITNIWPSQLSTKRERGGGDLSNKSNACVDVRRGMGALGTDKE